MLYKATQKATLADQKKPTKRMNPARANRPTESAIQGVTIAIHSTTNRDGPKENKEITLLQNIVQYQLILLIPTSHHQIQTDKKQTIWKLSSITTLRSQ